MKKFKSVLLGVLAIVLFGAFAVPTDKYFEIMKNIEIFSNIYKEINTNYVDEVDPSQLMKTGVDAMLASLDPYTNYISESQVESYRIAADGRYNGIGAKSKVVGDYPTIFELFEGGGALKAGLKVGDQIVNVEGNDTKGRSYEDVSQIMRGAPGSTLSVKIKRDGESKVMPFSIERSEINIPNVPYSGIVGENTGYIALTTFTNDAGKNVARALKRIKRENKQMEGVILDLRGNGGGLLREAINVSNVFVPQGLPIVSTKGKVKDRDQSYSTKNAPIDLEMPLVVLINGTSASASEIVSGVIQDMDRGVLLGKRSYGKGLVQNTAEVGYNSRLKLTTSKYYIPSGRCIQSVAYENGEPVDIPDEKRAKFRTKNNRVVLDGGGVLPDVKSAEAPEPGVLTALKEDSHILRFLNNYTKSIDSISSVDIYKFNDYPKFQAYLQKEGFKYEGGGTEEIDKLLEHAESQKLSEQTNQSIKSIKSSIESEAADDLTQYKEEIVREIETQLVTRYHFQRGKIHQSLNTDVEIQQAIELLKDNARYSTILKGK